MSISYYKKDQLRNLELKRGGVAFAHQKSSPAPNPTIVISLGGLGARTLNTLKTKFVREIGQSDHIWFRMLDTDEYTFREYCKETRDSKFEDTEKAIMDREEIILVNDPAITNILDPAMIPAYIDQWLDPALKRRRIDCNGAQQTRQIGRVMLTNDTVYHNVRSNLDEIIHEAICISFPRHCEVNIILISSITGGTGSGMVIDLSYMIHDLMREQGYSNYNLAGYIYMPDAQFSLPGIADSPVWKANLIGNGYAALKEIDYFMNLEETEGRYRLQLMNTVVESNKNIFSSCTLVSGYSESGGLRNLDENISCLTDHLLDMLTDIEVTQNGIAHQMSDSILSNDHAFILQWFNQHPKRRLYHRYASYKYQVLRYNSVRIPRDEIFAYCADKIYQGVMEEFKDFRKVNKKMLKDVFAAAHISNPREVAAYAVQVGNLNRDLPFSGYTKSMVRNNPLIAYEDARHAAQSEAMKVNCQLMTTLENNIYEKLKRQVDLTFEQNGPYIALRAIQHEKNCLTDGDPNEPFSGIYEQLLLLRNAMREKAAECADLGNEYIILERAEKAVRLFGNTSDMTAYVSECCNLAVEQFFDRAVYSAMAEVLQNVAVRMTRYNSEVFEEYTSILDEIGKILREDAGEFSVYSPRMKDTILEDIGKFNRCKYYLDDCIRDESVDALAHQLLRSMRDDKEKWLTQTHANNFDVVHEVRTLMDQCLIQNHMDPGMIEKIVVAAYHPDELTVAQLNALWADNNLVSPKMTALKEAAQYILNKLEYGARAMAHSAGVVPLTDYQSDYFISGLKDTPNLSRILNQLVNGRYFTNIAVSNSKSRFIYTRQYQDVPLYILRGMAEYNEEYARRSYPGRHMDEKGQEWTRMPNPYTIDSVAIDLMERGRSLVELGRYPDLQFLDLVKKQTLAGLDLGFIKKEKDPSGKTFLTILDAVKVAEDMESFKKELGRASWEACHEEKEFDLISFMCQRGFSFNSVRIDAGNTDVDLGLTDFRFASPADMASKYCDIPVPVEDVFKWLRKSVRYMDILEKDYKLFS